MQGEAESHNGSDAEEGRMDEVMKSRVDGNQNDLEANRANGMETVEANEQGELAEQGEQEMVIDQEVRNSP